MSTRGPRVFLSSTCYDLGQVRANIRQFIEEDLGYDLLASEHSTFPVDPDRSTVENCTERVREDADILILVIGGRYGTQPAGADSSVTNLEYTTAKHCGIPVIAFVAKNVYANLPVWRSNRGSDVDMSSVVDSTRVFEFIDQVMSQDQTWTHQFDNAQDIVLALRRQFAHLQNRGLSLIRKMQGRDAVMNTLTGEAFRFAMERPFGWSGYLFAECMRQSVASYGHKATAFDLGIAFGPGESIEAPEDVCGWAAARLREAGRLYSGTGTYIQESVNAAFESLDPTGIVVRAREATSAYEAALDWSHRIRAAHLPKELDSFKETMALAISPLIGRFREFPDQLISEIQGFVNNHGTDENDALEVNFSLDVKDLDVVVSQLKCYIRDLGFDIDVDLGRQ